MGDPSSLIVLIILALIYAFLNGYRDSSSILAGVIASRALHPRLALYLAGIAEFIAPFLFGAAVAKAIATGLVDPHVITLNTVVIATAAALVWTLFAWWRGIPSSSSHALIGGLLGATLIINGPQAIIKEGLLKVVLPLFLAPPLGMVAGFLMMHLLLWLFSYAAPSVNVLFRRLQILTMFVLALSHSSNDSQKSMGIIVLGLFLTGNLTSFQVPFGVVVACATAIALGASQGDWRLIRTLGGRIYRIRPLNALSSQAASAGVVMGSALAGAPVSTSQVISMALMGAGAAERVNKVRWQVGRDMLMTWAFTIPATMIIASGIFFVAEQLSQFGLLFNWFIKMLVSG